MASSESTPRDRVAAVGNRLRAADTDPNRDGDDAAWRPQTPPPGPAALGHGRGQDGGRVQRPPWLAEPGQVRNPPSDPGAPGLVRGDRSGQLRNAPAPRASAARPTLRRDLLPDDDPDRARAGDGGEGPPRLAGLLPERWRGGRLAVGRAGAVALIVVGLVAALAAGAAMWQSSPQVVEVSSLPRAAQEGAQGDSGPGGAGTPPPPAPAPAAPGTAAPPAQVVVSVAGLVARPGLVTLPTGSRVADALDAVGGAREGADLLSLNLAQKVGDGDQVLVGQAPRPGDLQQLRSAVVRAGASVATGAAPGGPAEQTGPLNLNTATAAELDALPGVGPVTAAAIVDWRTTSGPFTSVDQLASVRGIGPAKLAELRTHVTV